MRERTSSHPIGSSGGTIQITHRMPTCISAEYWRRHDLSAKDIEKIVSYIPTNMIWIVAMSHGIHCPWFVLRSSFATMHGVTMSGKSSAVDAILVATGCPASSVSRLEVDSIESFEHVPPLPRATIPPDDHQQILGGITISMVPRALIRPDESPGIIPLLYPYKGQLWVPVGIEGPAVCCNAVVAEASYRYRENGGTTHLPKMGIFRETPYCLTDELVLFIPGPTTES